MEGGRYARRKKCLLLSISNSLKFTYFLLAMLLFSKIVSGYEGGEKTNSKNNDFARFSKATKSPLKRQNFSNWNTGANLKDGAPVSTNHSLLNSVNVSIDQSKLVNMLTFNPVLDEKENPFQNSFHGKNSSKLQKISDVGDNDINISRNSSIMKSKLSTIHNESLDNSRKYMFYQKLRGRYARKIRLSDDFRSQTSFEKVNSAQFSGDGSDCDTNITNHVLNIIPNVSLNFDVISRNVVAGGEKIDVFSKHLNYPRKVRHKRFAEPQNNYYDFNTNTHNDNNFGNYGDNRRNKENYDVSKMTMKFSKTLKESLSIQHHLKLKDDFKVKRVVVILESSTFPARSQAFLSTLNDINDRNIKVQIFKAKERDEIMKENRENVLEKALFTSDRDDLKNDHTIHISNVNQIRERTFDQRTLDIVKQLAKKYQYEKAREFDQFNIFNTDYSVPDKNIGHNFNYDSLRFGNKYAKRSSSLLGKDRDLIRTTRDDSTKKSDKRSKKTFILNRNKFPKIPDYLNQRMNNSNVSDTSFEFGKKDEREHNSNSGNVTKADGIGKDHRVDKPIDDNWWKILQNIANFSNPFSITEDPVKPFTDSSQDSDRQQKPEETHRNDLDIKSLVESMDEIYWEALVLPAPSMDELIMTSQCYQVVNFAPDFGVILGDRSSAFTGATLATILGVPTIHRQWDGYRDPSLQVCPQNINFYYLYHII